MVKLNINMMNASWVYKESYRWLLTEDLGTMKLTLRGRIQLWKLRALIYPVLAESTR